MTAAAWPLLACTVAVFAGGGYGAAGRVAFAVAALVALIAVRPPPRGCGEPVVVVLLALAALGTASALWTVGLVGESLRWGLVTAGFAALVVVSARADAEQLAIGLATLAVLCGALGLASAALHEPLFAVDRLGGWRPAGPFEYPPALALVQVGALPVLLEHRSRIGLAVVAAVLVFAESRTALGLAGVVSVLHLRPPRPVVVAGAVAAAVLVVAGGLHGREDTWAAAVETFADRPLHGAGADAFLSASARHQDGDTIAFAHQLPLELAVELGIAGLLLTLALYVASARLAIRSWIFGPAIAAFLVSNLLDWTWHLAGVGAMWAVALGAAAGQASGKVKYRSPKNALSGAR